MKLNMIKRFGRIVLPVICTVISLVVASAVLATPSPEFPSSERKIAVWEAAVLGVVEGITEYLPISSTGHLILANHALGMTEFSETRGPLGALMKKNDALDSFNIVIQLGAILAVLGLYRKRVGQMLGGLSGAAKALVSRQPVASLAETEQQGLKLLGLLLVAFLPAAVFGKLFHEPIEAYLFGPLPVVYALVAGGVLMIGVEYFFWIRDRNRPRISDINAMVYRQALFIGMMQVVSMWPGTSRSMITMIAGLMIGLDMIAAAEFSFLLALPTLGAATLYSWYMHWHVLDDSAGMLALAVGLAVSWLTAVISVKALVKWLTHHGLIPFGVFRILLAGVLLVYFWQWR
ncbi:undecaprenyl-diphosphatase [Syntrophus gentianae]|uniref:Undecaprenyl-diphosphatase n=1 Tax=Syntrophus gentianae TaxID=43775 RepID=A0A1H7ZZQ7_9BACT|nr:undecaprenyl-diphosphate phosphatase [Syntrophus gentianae]SEM64162.1 undecaprenyl-diphosphatase [Syntrophus gentianae]